MSTVYYTASDMALKLEGLKNAATGDPITDATVTLETLVNCDGETPDGITLPLAMTHTGSGDYAAEIPSELDVYVGETLFATIKAVTTGGKQKTFKERVIVRNGSA